MKRALHEVRALLLVAAGAASLTACQDLFVEPAPAAPAGLAISLHATAAARDGGADAFDRAESARIRLQRVGGAVVFEQVVALPPAGSERAVDIEVAIEGDTETLQLLTELLWSGNVLFQGSTTVSLARGGTATVDVALTPVAARIDAPATAGPITSIGGTLQLTGAVVHATGDAVAGAVLTWTSLDPGIATSTPQGLVTAVAEGEARVVARYQGHEATVRVRVQVAVASVDVVPTSIELAVGGTRQVVATPRDASANALSRPVTWQTSAPQVAAVDANGLVRGLAPGTATVTATSDGVNSAPVAVTVTDVPVASVTVEPGTATLSLGQTVQLQATPRDAAGNVLTGRTINWSSGTAAVATVDANGIVTARAGGQATITATSGGRSGTALITVQAPSIQVSATLVSLVTTAGTNPTPRIIGVGNGGTGTLSGLSTSIAYGGNAQGWLSAPLSGTAAPATITLAFDVAGLTEGNYSAVVTVASSLTGVAPATIAVSLAVRQVPVATVTVTPANSTLLVGQTVQLTATLRDTNGNVLTGRTIAWSSSDPASAAVNAATGLVTAVAGGQATITATSEGQSGNASVTVAVPAIAVSTNLVSVGAHVGSSPSAVNVGVTNGGTGTLSGLSTSIAYGGTGGWLTANLSGTTAPATLTLTFAAASLAQGNYSATVTIASSLPGVASQQITVNLSVRQIPVASVTVTPATNSLLVGQTVQLTATMRDSMNVILPGRAVAWTSSNLTVAVVSATGLVTAVAPGQATITATSEGVSGTASVTVVQPQIQLSRNTVAFQVAAGQNAVPQIVNVTNGGTGTLTGLSTSIAYPAGGPQNWLGAQLSATTAPATLTVTPSQLPPGNYSATVTVSSNLAGVQPATISVTMQVVQLYNVRLAGAGKGNGSVTGPGINCTFTAGAVTGACLGTYPAGTQITLTATAAPGSDFITWAGACAQYGRTPQCVFSVDANYDVGAQFELLPAVAPVISNMRTTPPTANACTVGTEQWTSIEHTFDYTDANADVPNPVTIIYDWSYNVNRSGSDTTQWGHGGTSSYGTITLAYCHQFVGDTIVAETFRIVDAAGLISNRLSVTTRAPQNANSVNLEVSRETLPVTAAPPVPAKSAKAGSDDGEAADLPTVSSLTRRAAYDGSSSEHGRAGGQLRSLIAAEAPSTAARSRRPSGPIRIGAMARMRRSNSTR